MCMTTIKNTKIALFACLDFNQGDGAICHQKRNKMRSEATILKRKLSLFLVTKGRFFKSEKVKIACFFLSCGRGLKLINTYFYTKLQSTLNFYFFQA